ncbi:MAG: FAD:protein FMN transferase [Bordetella sp.]|nr:FAD:protein FMN transferase [Pseudomonadota bacterium]MDQ8017743.1 FAD:protein FMN transferase [Pseudomonadota bacterium]
MGVPSFAARVSGYRLPEAPRAADPARLQQLGGETMGTTWSLRVDNPRMLPLDALRHAVQSALDEVVAQMSHWDPDSALGRFNRAPPGSTHTLPEPFNAVLARALHWAEASGGALDPGMGPLVALWGFGPDAVDDDSLPPDAAALAAARARCGWQHIAHDAAGRRLVQPGGLSLDLSGIAKGYGVDAGVAALQRLGVGNFLLEVGGELRGAGRRPGGLPWQVQVDPGTGPGLRIALADRAVASSGDRWHVREQGGRRWSHTLDPRTGEPVAHALACVTVLHEHCMDADALATVLTVLGPDEGMAFAERHGVAALFARRAPEGTLALHPSAAWLAQAAA